MRMPAILLLCALACGCQSTSFDAAPLAADAGCDAALVGPWISVDDKGQADDEMQLRIGADCRLAVKDREGTRVREGEATTLLLGHANGQRYAWVTAGWADRRFEVTQDLQANPADIYLFRYRVEGDALTVDTVDHKAVAHYIIDDRLAGTVRSGERNLVNRVTGVSPEILTLPKLFGDSPLRFRREAGSP